VKINKHYIIWPLCLAILLGISLAFLLKFGIVEIKIRSKSEASEIKKVGISTPETVKAIYLTSFSAGSLKKIDWLTELAQSSELNAVVIDVKDFSGYISYDSSVSASEEYKSERIAIKDIDSLINRLHDNKIYTIARISVFQDPTLVKAKPEWAVQNKYTNKPWTDRNGLSWIDPACKECWKYYADIARDASERGFDEINFDYIRFPSDGDLSALLFTYWDKALTRPQVLNEFFKYMRSELGDMKLSVDFFGFVTTRNDDFGVGQVMEDAFEYFDYISPMVYPSHYPSGFLGFANPATRPYEIVFHAMKEGNERLKIYKEKTGNHRPNLRPWLQDFNLGADYNQTMVWAQIKATQDALGENYNGFMLWNARNVYHEGVFLK